MLFWDRNPVAATMNCVVSVSPSDNATRHNWVCPSYRTPSTVVRNSVAGVRGIHRAHAGVALRLHARGKQPRPV